MKKIIIKCIVLFFCTMSMTAQNTVRLTGNVLDEFNDPMPGANVTVKGVTPIIGTITGGKGEFTLMVPGNANVTLLVSFIGFKPYEITHRVGSTTTNYIVKLVPEAIELEEAVVIGYGVQKKASVVAAISTIKSEELKMSSVPNLMNAIAGRVAGVITVMGSGQPGSDDSRILVRGMSTTNSTDPLVMVDGIERDWKQVDPEDIETFSVLKDASATAVYGVRGANGVILITTKRGHVGKPQLNVSFQSVLQQPIRTPKFLDSYNYALLYNEAMINDGYLPEFTEADLEHYRTGDSPYTHPNNDYYKDFVKKASFEEVINLNARGGTQLMTYYISAALLNQGGVYQDFHNVDYNTNTNFKRFNVRSNLDFQITKTTKLGVDMTGRLEVRQRPNFGENLFNKIVRLTPQVYPYVNPDGTLGGRADETRLAPYVLISQYGNVNQNVNALEAKLSIQENMDYITKGLSVRAVASHVSRITSSRSISRRPELYYYNRYGEYIFERTETPISYSMSRGGSSRRVYFETSLNYNRTFGNHAVTAMALYNQTQEFNEYSIPTGLVAYVGRVTYGLKQRYLFDANVAVSGSMQFGDGHRYGYFPSGSLGWVVSEENFLHGNEILPYLKLRASYGEIGNDRLGSYSYYYVQTYTRPSGQNYEWRWGESVGSSWANNSHIGYYEGRPGNDNITWERVRKTNVGFDSKWLNNKISLTADAFYDYRTDILSVPYTIPLVLGMNRPSTGSRTDGQGLPPQNVGIVTNRGFDGEVGYFGKFNKVGFSVKANMTFARNRIDWVNEEAKKNEWSRTFGKPIGTHFGYVAERLYQFSDFVTNANGELELLGGFPQLKPGLPQPTMGAIYPGDIKYKDLDENGIIDSDDISHIGGTNIPELIYGISLQADYRQWDVSLLFQGAGKGWMYLNEDAAWEFFAQGKVMEQHLGRFNPRDPSTWENATHPRLHTSENPNNHIKSSYWLYKRDYLRLKNIQLGYTASKALAAKLSLSRIRVFMTGTNIVTFDKVKNFDPENQNTQGNQYPQLRTWSFGLNITF